MGDDTFSVTREAPNTFKRDTDPLKQAAMKEAEKFCREKGMQVKVVTWSVYKPRLISGYANAKLVFKMVGCAIHILLLAALVAIVLSFLR